MTALTFAAFSKRAPDPATTHHLANGGAVGYTCHMAVMHWAFRDLGDTDAMANARVQLINTHRCLGCMNGHHVHASIGHGWYGAHFGDGAVHIPNRGALYNAVNVGDVLLVSHPQSPSHSMVVVQKRELFGRRFVYIRGFNNYGTTGTGIAFQYDNSDRDIDVAALWNAAPAAEPPVPGAQIFGNAGATLHCVPHDTYMENAAVVRNAPP
jgi:hypothetical protein